MNEDQSFVSKKYHFDQCKIWIHGWDKNIVEQPFFDSRCSNFTGRHSEKM